MQPFSSTIHLPADGINRQRRIASCAVESFQGNRLRLVMEERIAPGTLISVEHEDALFLGEVIRATEEESSWRHEVRIEQVLNGLMSLMALRARLMDEQPRRVAIPVS